MDANLLGVVLNCVKYAKSYYPGGYYYDTRRKTVKENHRNQRSREVITSKLDTIPGIGPEKRKALISHFGSLEKIRSASVEELVEVKGIQEDLAHAIKSHLKRDRGKNGTGVSK